MASFFPGDYTHTSAEEASLNAALVVSGLRALEDCPLAGMLLTEGLEVLDDCPLAKYLLSGEP